MATTGVHGARLPGVDPLLLEIGRTVAAIATGAIVGWLGARWGLKNAERLSRQEGDRRDARLRRALFAEIRDDMQLLWKPDRSQLGLLQRSAWDDARGLDWPEDLERLLRQAYHGAERFNRQVSMIELKESAAGGTTIGGSTSHDREAALKIAEEVYVLFDRARKSLAQSIGMKEPTTWEP